MNVSSTFLFMNQFNERHECQGSLLTVAKKHWKMNLFQKLKHSSPTSTLVHSTCNVKPVVVHYFQKLS